ncbi:MAG TPA: hypothetical protein VFR31_21570 [Thermoanaerobaculia bacterium]|nr:hypothetical protein [Thermoanaerobaculia bacterium]
MARRALVLIAVLSLLLPLAAEACEGCAPDCCPPSCCSCCLLNPSVLTASGWTASRPAPVELTPALENGPPPSSPPRDIFHVPKPSLL